MRKIIIPKPSFDSKIVRSILQLEKLRHQKLQGQLPPHIFFQLKEIFQLLETLGSARIEGNRTTLAEHIDNIIAGGKKDEQKNEIENLDKAINFIEKNTNKNTKINRAYISELHKIVTKNLSFPPKGEGSRMPGELRKVNIGIKKSKHKPPEVAVLPEYFESFVDFINQNYEEQWQMLMIAIAHHRFEYMHPFDNGNGRMGRLLNYALLMKMGFNVSGKIINPSAVFYTGRDRYYDMLSVADSLKDEDVLAWAEYFLAGLINETQKIISLLDIDYVKNLILKDTLKNALIDKHITEKEFKILNLIITKRNMQIKAEELSEVGIMTSVAKSRAIAKLRDKKMVMSIKKNGRIYTISFVGNVLLRNVIKILNKRGFIADFLNRN